MKGAVLSELRNARASAETIMVSRKLWGEYDIYYYEDSTFRLDG